ncbi:hypothetical protein KAZ93_05070 [Patescibacteria group bacterium]|nr:hypothetical protein [Patescibacteria group bacterium]
MNSISSIITGITKDLKHFPYRHELTAHPLFGSVFTSMSEIEKQEIESTILEMIQDHITTPKTLGGEYLQRFYENHGDLFRDFRETNRDKEQSDTDHFQSLGKQVEDEIFKLESLLTQRQTGKQAR